MATNEDYTSRVPHYTFPKNTLEEQELRVSHIIRSRIHWKSRKQRWRRIH